MTPVMGKAHKLDISDPFYAAFRGYFVSLFSWEALDSFWEMLRARADDGWYIYAIGEPLPERPASGDETKRFIDEVDKLLRADHREDYCGIVFVDNRDDPTLIKIFDPNNLGVSCGFSDNPPMPGWIMSRLAPRPLEDRRPLPESRRRWWRTLWT
jgi:hypothetical protein